MSPKELRDLADATADLFAEHSDACLIVIGVGREYMVCGSGAAWQRLGLAMVAQTELMTKYEDVPDEGGEESWRS